MIYSQRWAPGSLGTQFWKEIFLRQYFFTPKFYYAEFIYAEIFLRQITILRQKHFLRQFFTPIFFTSIFFYANIFLRQYFFTLKSSGFFRFRFSPVQPGINLHITKHILVRYKNIDTKIDSTKAVIFIFCQIYDA